MCRSLIVSPMYCIPQITHLITYTRWEEEHVILVAIEKRLRVAAEMMQCLSSEVSGSSTLGGNSGFYTSGCKSHNILQCQPGDKSSNVSHILQAHVNLRLLLVLASSERSTQLATSNGLKGGRGGWLSKKVLKKNLLQA